MLQYISDLLILQITNYPVNASYSIQNLSVFDQNILFGSIHTCCGMPHLLVYHQLSLLNN